jgi:PAS domain S-box-containing protein
MPQSGRFRVIQPSGAESVHEFDLFPVQIGRGAENDIVLDDVNVSRRHAVLEWSPAEGALRIRDLKSLNGVRLNGEMVTVAVLHVGDRIELGDSSIEFLGPRSASASAPTARRGATTAPPHDGLIEIIRAIDLEPLLTENGRLDEELLLQAGAAPGEDQRELLGRLHRAYSHLMVMMSFASSVGNHSHPRQVCAQFAAGVRRVFPAVERIVVVEARDQQTEPLATLFADGPGAESRPPSQTVIGRVLSGMRALYAVDAQRDPRFIHSDSIHVGSVRSIMCAPLLARNEVIGAVYLENSSTPYCFDMFDLSLLSVFAFFLGSSLESARLMEARDRAVERALQDVRGGLTDNVAMVLQYAQGEKRFRALFEQSALGAAVINLDTRQLEEVNDGLARMLGFPRRQLAGQQFEEIVDPADVHRVADWFEGARARGEIAFKCRLRTRDAPHYLLAQVSARPLRMGDSEALVAYFIDITDKERAERETLRQLQRVTALSDLSQALMSTRDEGAILELLRAKICDVLPVDHFVVARAAPGLPLEVVYTGGSGPTSPAQRAAIWRAILAQSPLGNAVANGEPLLTDAITPIPVPDTAMELRSALVVPLSTHDSTAGVVVVLSRTSDAYDETHLETLRALAAQASLALSNARAFASIRRQEEDLRQLSVQIMTAQETERARISSELHDGIGQQLTAMKYLLEGARSSARIGDARKLTERLDEARNLATQIIEDLRSISLDLRPTMLDDLGLKPTLEWLARDHARRYEIVVNLQCSPGDEPLPSTVATATFRIIQEALNNIAKHSAATQARINVRRDGDWLRGEVADNGRGFSVAAVDDRTAARGCSGLLNMKERARFLGGEFSMESQPGQGTQLHFAIPIQGDRESP